jgi:hypothetical protein
MVASALEILIMLTTSASAKRSFSLAAVIRANNRIAIKDATVAGRGMVYANWDIATDNFDMILRLNPKEWDRAERDCFPR